MKKSRKFMNFTLIELLVVIAIIAILASILMPALSAARERGRANQCTNNLKQCMIAMLTYIDDHKEMPLYYAQGNYRTFREMICKASMQRYGTDEQKRRIGGNYLQNEKMVLCPARHPFVPLPKNAAYKGENSLGWHISTYGGSLHADHHPGTFAAGTDELAKEKDNMAFIIGKRENGGLSIRPAFIRNPSRLFMIADSVSIKDNGQGPRNTQWYWIDFGTIGFAGAHNGRANVAWLDGHVDANDTGSLRTKIPSKAAATKVIIDTSAGVWL